MRCKVDKICGGCSMLKLNRAVQAAKKKAYVEQLAEKNSLKVRVGDVYMAKHDTNYRNKVIVGFAKDKGKIYSGLYASNSHRVIHSENCLMHPNIINALINRITELVQSMKIELYNNRTGTGLLRHVLIRYAPTTKEIMVVFVTGKKQFPSRRNLVNILVSEFPNIKTIIQNINSRNTSIVLQDESVILYGDGFITDELCGLKFQFAYDSFYQIHSEQCEVLYGLAKKMLNLKGTERVLDTYCGVGTIGLSMADQCKKLMGVELNRDSIICAKKNAHLNKIDNADFMTMDSTEFMVQAKRYDNRFDAIILDPTRSGTTKAFIEAACGLSPKKILYISCDPKTQLRDLKLFRANGYYTNKLELVDMFPQTDHIESICVLEKKEKFVENTNKAHKQAVFRRNKMQNKKHR